jgi:hypothetical protein
MMWGKHFESMYEGSMYGAGVAVFAVWGYVIAHTRNGVVELNPRKLADTLGGELGDVEAAIEFLKSPDAASRHKEHEGRRLLLESPFQYRVPSWHIYHAIRNEDERREYNRKKQAERREKLALLEAIKHGHPVNVESLSAVNREIYERAKEKERRKREKMVEHVGGCAGAQQAIDDGFKQVEGDG